MECCFCKHQSLIVVAVKADLGVGNTVSDDHIQVLLFELLARMLDERFCFRGKANREWLVYPFGNRPQNIGILYQLQRETIIALLLDLIFAGDTDYLIRLVL